MIAPGWRRLINNFFIRKPLRLKKEGHSQFNYWLLISTRNSEPVLSAPKTKLNFRLECLIKLDQSPVPEIA